MKLTKVRIENFQSIINSNSFEIDDVTCLVGKNESGKTALLKALYRLNPFIETEGDFDSSTDYPKSKYQEYRRMILGGGTDIIPVVFAVFKLELADIAIIAHQFGDQSVGTVNHEIIVSKGYSNELKLQGFSVNNESVLRHYIANSDIPEGLAAELHDNTADISTMIDILDSYPDPFDGIHDLIEQLNEANENGIENIVTAYIVQELMPKFLYFDEYYQIKGEYALNALNDRLAQNNLEDSDHPFLGLMRLADLELKEVINPSKTDELISILEYAANTLETKTISYWSQNSNVRITFEIRDGYHEDPEIMQQGTNILCRVEDKRYHFSTSLGARSRGFLWYFSFSAWYSSLLREENDLNLILLFDEPGLSLHARAQKDLLDFFASEIAPYHQLIYTTHSPFMIDSNHFQRVRIVEDKDVRLNSDDLYDDLYDYYDDNYGTKVISDVLKVESDSLFPIQGALGYDIYQTLFVGPNNLIVEGVSDLLYIQAISELLHRQDREGLSSDWTITPVGSFSKVSAFVSLMGFQGNLNLAVLIDYQTKDQQMIDNLYKQKLLKQNRIFTYADFISANEADIEDLFDADFYIKLVNDKFGYSLNLNDLPTTSSRIVKRIEEHLGRKYNHYSPARYFNDNINSIQNELTDKVLNRFQTVFDSINNLLPN